MRTLTRILVIIALAGFLTGCCDRCARPQCCGGQKSCCVSQKLCAKHKPCAKIEVKAPAEANKPAQAPTATPAEEKPAAEAAKAKGKLIVVTNGANYELDKDVLNFIATRGVTTERVAPADFEKYKTEKYILVLGSPSEGEGLGDTIKQLLSADEVNFVNQAGNRSLYLKTNKWSNNQYVLVISGYDADATYRELVNNKDKWWGYISSWFNIELSHDEVYGY